MTVLMHTPHRIETKSEKYPSLSLGFASAPVSLEEQIMRTPEQTPPEWFAIERGESTTLPPVSIIS